MSVRAKFQCTCKTPDTSDPTIVEVTFSAVCDDSPENASWSKWTPAGSLSMQITNPAASDQFEVGSFYFIDLSPYSV